MELRHLRYFVAVGETLSFTKGAQRLRIAQPSLTRQIHNLEEEIGVRMFKRANNRVTLTKEGAAFFLDAKKILALCAGSIAAVQKMNRAETAQLNIGYVANLHHDLLPTTLGAFRKLCPQIALNLFDLTSGEQYQALDARQIDLGFIGLRPGASRPELRAECVAYETILLALPANHPLTVKRKIKLTELAGQFFIGMAAKAQPGVREWLLETFHRAGMPGRVLQEATSEAASLNFVAAGLGVALVAEQTSGLPHEGVVFRPLSPPLRRESTMAWRADNASPALREYIRIVRELSGPC